MFLFRSLCRLKALWKVPYQQRLELIVRRVDWVPGRRIDSFDISDISIKEFRYKFKRTGNTCQNQLKRKDDDKKLETSYRISSYPIQLFLKSLGFRVGLSSESTQLGEEQLCTICGECTLSRRFVPFFNVVKGNERLLNLWNVTYMWAEMWLTCDLLWSV